jgi:hypothetical protein
MRESVRIASDSEELVLSEGEASSASTAAARNQPVERRARPTAPKQMTLRYLAFHDVQGRREYTFEARLGDETRQYTLWIDLAAFSTRRALLQDGPDICYQKLLHELEGSELQGSAGVAVTEDELARYREAHTRPPRKSFSPAPTLEPAKAPAGGEIVQPLAPLTRR